MPTTYVNDNTKPLKKYVSVRTNGVIPELDNRLGPILNPIWVDIGVIYNLIIHGHVVYEHDANTPENYVVLDRSNYDDYNIYPDNTLIQDPNVPEGNLLLQFKDDTGNDILTTTGNIYVELLD